MQWAVTAHGPEGKVHADRRTVEYFGRGNHTRDAACFRTTQPVSSCARKNEVRNNSEKKIALKKEHVVLQIVKSIHSAGGTGAGRDGGSALAAQDKRNDDENGAAMSLSELRMFYYETLVVSTGDDDENGLGLEDEVEKDARAEFDLLVARANAAAAAISSHHPTSTSSSSRGAATTSHPYLGGGSRHETTRLPWRERARRIVHANLRATDPLMQDSSSSDDDNESDDEGGAERMELDSTATSLAASSNGNGSTVGNGESGRGFGIRQFLSGSSATSVASSNGANHHSRLLSLSGGNNGQGGSSSSQSRSRSSSNSSSNNNISTAANGVHFAFTLSSRTLQQIRSRHDRRRMRRHQEKKRFNHRIGVGFVLASKGNDDTRGGGDKNGHDGLSQVSNSSSVSNNNSVSSSASPLQKLASYQQRKTVSHEDLGKDAFSLAYHGKTGRIMSNGQVFLQCEKFGAGDVVGCGILLDTKTFFFTLNGRLLGMLAATDVHHFDDFVDDGTANRDGDMGGGVDGDDAESDVSFVTDEDDDESDGESGEHVTTSQGDATLFEDVLYPAISLHDAGECACANFDEFRFDLAGFERQIQKERQQALLLHEIADERDELANDRVINKLIQDYFLHNGYKDAYTIFQKSASFPSSCNSIMDGDDIDVDIEEEEEKTESMDTGSTSFSSRSLSSAQTKLLDLQHAVRRHIYAFETDEALAKVCAALGDGFFLSTAAQQRSGKVLFYSRVLCVLDVLLKERPQAASSAKAKAANGGGNRKGDDRRGSSGWNVEEAILCAQEQFSSYLTLSATRARAPVDDASSSSSGALDNGKKGSNMFFESVVDDELELVMSLLLYERLDDLPAESAARKFLSRKFRERVADKLNVFLLVNSSPKAKISGARHGRRSPSIPPPQPSDASSSALQSFLVELNSLQSRCLRNGCRVFPGNHTVSSSGGKRNGRSSYRRRRRRASASSSENGAGNGGDEEMRSSSSGSDMSSSSSRSENEDDDDDDDDDEEE